MYNSIFNRAKILHCVLILHSLIWCLLPLIRHNIPLDSAEAIIWGNEFALGYNKHPPLSGWLAALVYKIFRTDISIYILSQLCILLSLFYIYRLSKDIFQDAERATTSVLITLCSFYYSFHMHEFNVNVLSMPLWAGCIYYFYRATFYSKLRYWILLGILSAACVLTKYLGALIILAIIMYSIFTQNGRKSLHKAGIYISGILCIAILVPHIKWLFENQFITFHYAINRGNIANITLLDHIMNPVKFLLKQLMNISGCLIAFWFLYSKSSIWKSIKSEKEKYIVYMTLLPICIILLLSCITGAKLLSMWGVPMFSMLGTSMLIFRQKTIINAPFLRVVIFSILAYAVAFTIFIYTSKGKTLNLDGQELSRVISQKWMESVPARELRYVGGDVWYAANVAIYSSNTMPSVYIDMDKTQNTWASEIDILKKGIVIVGRNNAEMDIYQSRFSNIQFDVKDINLHFTNPRYKENFINIKYAIIKPSI